MPRKELLHRLRPSPGRTRVPGRACSSGRCDLAKTRAMGRMTVLIGALVTAFAVYGIIPCCTAGAVAEILKLPPGGPAPAGLPPTPRPLADALTREATRYYRR